MYYHYVNKDLFLFAKDVNKKAYARAKNADKDPYLYQGCKLVHLPEQRRPHGCWGVQLVRSLRPLQDVRGDEA